MQREPSEARSSIPLRGLPRTDKALKPQGEFFNRLRDLTGSAFFSSKMGVHDLGYMGNVPNPDWQGAPKAALDELGVSYAEWDRKYGNLK